MQDEKIISMLEREEVKYVKLVFTDINGLIKGVTVPLDNFVKAYKEGILFDGSSILGYTTIDESDMRAVPDLKTLRLLPWTRSNKNKTAIVVSDIYTPNGEPFQGDPRLILKRNMEKAVKRGYIFKTGPECEFFLFKMDEKGRPLPEPTDRAGYFDLTPLDKGDFVRDEISRNLKEMGIKVEATHHEVSPAQHEIDITYSDALTIADSLTVLKFTAKTVAMLNNMYASFMPKPIYGVNGSGMHTHVSLFTLRGGNAFYDPSTEDGLSETAKHFLAGLLVYAKETCAVLNSTVNSFKRLVPGYEAPVYISWAHLNRSVLIRVPAGRGERTRLEIRNPDPSGNPYLQFSAILAAGLKGLQDEIEPPEEKPVNVYGLSEEQRKEMQIEELPESLGEALKHMQKSKLMRECLGNHIFENFVYIKRKEWIEYLQQVSKWEIEKYLPT